MDASKAIQGMREGDLYAMAEALDVDEALEFDVEFPCGVDRMRMYRIGVTLISVFTEGHPHEGNHPKAQIVSYGTVEAAQARLQETLTGAQIGRSLHAALSGQVGTLRYNGAELPPPVMAGTPVYDQMIDDMVSAVTVPDDASAIDHTI